MASFQINRQFVEVVIGVSWIGSKYPSAHKMKSKEIWRLAAKRRFWLELVVNLIEAK